MEDGMKTYQVIRRELVFIDRTYEIEADSPEQAVSYVDADRGGALVDEQIQSTHSLVCSWLS